MKERMAALETRKAELEAAFASAPPPTAFRIHPNLPKMYRDKVERLEEALNDDGIRDEAAEVIRGLVERVVLTPSEGSLKAELSGGSAPHPVAPPSPMGSNAERTLLLGG